jgi:hypothetical protein
MAGKQDKGIADVRKNAELEPKFPARRSGLRVICADQREWDQAVAGLERPDCHLAELHHAPVVRDPVGH